MVAAGDRAGDALGDVGVEDVAKVFPMINALSAYLPHLQALSASSQFWTGDRTGYASNRALVFQQLPTAGLPWPLESWAEYEAYLADMERTGVMADSTEVRWDIRPAPRERAWAMRARVCSVLPRPMSSARIPPSPLSHR